MPRQRRAKRILRRKDLDSTRCPFLHGVMAMASCLSGSGAPDRQPSSSCRDGDLLHHFIGNIEIGMNLLHIIMLIHDFH